jgi:alanine racemase
MKSNVIVNLSNIGHNARVITSTFKDYKYYMAVLKSNAYGHGMKIVNKIIENGFNYIAVFSIDEALELRKYNKDIPVLLLCPISIEDLEIAKENNLTITVHNIDYLKELLKQDYKLKIHLKLDTGLNRLGFKDKAEVVYAVNAIKESNYILEGIYSHFSTIGLFDPYYDRQVNKFKEMISLLDLNEIPMIHFSSSAILLSHKKIECVNTLRCGILLYGYNVCPFIYKNGIKNKLRILRNKYYQKKYNLSKITTNVNIDVKPAMKFVTSIIQIKDVKKGETIGYGATKVEKDTKVAILPVGYYNGVGKNRRYVLINGNKYYSIGEIAMNMMAVSVDDKVKISDEVILLGDELTLGKVSNFNNVSLSEVLINIGNSNNIIYKED